MEGFTRQDIGSHTVIEFYDASLMDAVKLNELAAGIYPIIDEQDRRQIVLDFTRVQYVSSQFVGVLLAIHKKLQALPKSSLTLCNVGPRLMELLRLTKLDRIFTIKATQHEALRG